MLSACSSIPSIFCIVVLLDSLNMRCFQGARKCDCYLLMLCDCMKRVERDAAVAEA